MSRARAAFILCAAFLSGAAVMIVEMTAIRVFQPFFGSTNYVWTNVIAVVLAALALGYWIGGRLAEKRPVPSTYFGVLATGGVLVVASVWVATPLCMALQPGTANLEGVVGVLVRGSLVATLVLFAPAMAVLGAVSPIAIRLLADAGAGRAAGRVFAISTLGSLVGTYLPTLWLVPELGSRKSLLVAAAMLLIPAVIGLVAFAGRQGAMAAAAAVVAAAPIAAVADTRPARPAARWSDGGVARVLDEAETPYQYVAVRDDQWSAQTFRILSINEGIYTYHSFEILGRVLTDGRYYDDYALLPLFLDVPNGEELRGCVVGLACGVTPRQWLHFWGKKWKLSIDGAELDPVVLDLGRKRFHLAESEAAGLRSYAMDGRQMLVALPPERRYHMLVVDAFTNELYTPFHVGTREFFEICRGRMEPGGVFAMNVYADRADAKNLEALENTLATVFGSCYRVQQSWSGNFLLLARAGDAPPDLTRLVPARITERFGRRKDVPEWDDERGSLVAKAAGIAPRATLILPDASKFLLTDDHAPLEHMTDVFLRRTDAEVTGR